MNLSIFYTAIQHCRFDLAVRVASDTYDTDAPTVRSFAPESFAPTLPAPAATVPPTVADPATDPPPTLGCPTWPARGRVAA